MLKAICYMALQHITKMTLKCHTSSCIQTIWTYYISTLKYMICVCSSHRHTSILRAVKNINVKTFIPGRILIFHSNC